ncbi:MAG: hypothetical protein JO305_07315 [Alphaproteobacteria bacterium]|nr:hypothetical protein [Alphaproteobacteria bacterium]
MLAYLAWRHNLDRFDLALAVNRLAARGAATWWLAAAGPDNEPGDYLCETTGDAVDRLAGFGIRAEPWAGAVPDGALPLAYPRIALLAGRSSAYPYFAYYAMALARLGFDFQLVDGAAIAAGELRSHDLLIMPTGFALWGLDAAEEVCGADDQLRLFLADGGAAVASGGGAFYLSAGRPAWTGTARVRPYHTHEYLNSGVGIVSLRLGPDSIGFGCPPTLEMPYFHGPIYDEVDRSVSSAGVFDRLVMPGHLFIPNPLDDEVFARDMAGRTAILRAEGRRGRAVLFSADPEMGDLVRKYIAFDGYVARYLPIRGEAVMAETLRHYRVLEAPCFRLILNAIHSLMLRARLPAGPPLPFIPIPRKAPAPGLVAALDRALDHFTVREDEPRHGLAELLRQDLRARLDQLAERLADTMASLLPLPGPALAIRYLWTDCERAAVAGVGRSDDPARPRSLAESFADIETGIALLEAWCRLAEADAHFAVHS